MNRSAYFTTGLAIKALSRLSKADIIVHGEENIPEGPTIFVINHFTRIETFLLPNCIYEITGKPALSLAASSLFRGGLEKFFDLVGVLSTADPLRDELIVRSLLSGQADWIIFPEGRMVKTKKIIDGGKYMIAHPEGMHEPHTGAAALAMQAELFRRQLHGIGGKEPAQLARMLELIGVEKYEDIAPQEATIVPVNLTYYPIRAAENIALDIASKIVKDMSERMVEELMTEGTMLLSGVDLDIRFGEPIQVSDYLKKEWQSVEFTGFSLSPAVKQGMKSTAYTMMQRYMDSIYTMTTVNHEHLFASFLRLYPYKRVLEKDFLRRVFYAATLISDREKGLHHVSLHKSLQTNQAHLVTDDRYGKYDNFIKLAEEKGVVRREGKFLVRNRSRLSTPITLHRGRITNPIEVIANEVEPLKELLSFIRSTAWQPNTLIKHLVFRYILKKDLEQFYRDCSIYGKKDENGRHDVGRPLFLHGYRNSGVLLVHSYLSLPAEVELLARKLRRNGFSVYCVRLPGHGTSPADLATRSYQEWVEAVENGYALMSSVCKDVVVGGVGTGASLCLDLAARVPEIKGVFAVSPPFALKNYSTNFMPGRDVWQRLVAKVKRGETDQRYLNFSSGNSHINYTENPVDGIRQVGEFLTSISKCYENIKQEVFVLQSVLNPVVEPQGSQELFDKIGSPNKEYCLVSSDNHILVSGDGEDRVIRKIVSFVKSL